MRPGADLVPVCPHERSRPSEGHTKGFPYSNNGKDPDGCLGGVGTAESQSMRSGQVCPGSGILRFFQQIRGDVPVLRETWLSCLCGQSGPSSRPTI